MRLVLLGPPGAGKGTQAHGLSKQYHIAQISTGDIFRQHIKQNTELGKKIQVYLDQGILVPDELVNHVVEVRLLQEDCKNGFILDGFPRTIPQAEALISMGIDLDRVINVDVPDETIIKRMGGRRVCPACGAPYHVRYHKPKHKDICDECNQPLIIREDDQEATVRKRLLIYHEMTKPLIKYYQSKNILLTVQGMGDAEEISEKIIEALGENA